MEPPGSVKVVTLSKRTDSAGRRLPASAVALNPATRGAPATPTVGVNVGESVVPLRQPSRYTLNDSPPSKKVKSPNTSRAPLALRTPI